MKMFLSFYLVAVLGVTFTQCEERVRRQIWPAPGDPNFFWSLNGPRNDNNFRKGNFWIGPPRFDQPPRNPDYFQDDFNFGTDNGNQMNQGGFSDNFNSGGGSNNGNQNRRTTTESLGPITSTPRTLHYAPRGCKCLLTQQFNPVCGTDGNTYRNMGLLNCYKKCGTNVSQKRLGSC